MAKAEIEVGQFYKHSSGTIYHVTYTDETYSLISLDDGESWAGGAQKIENVFGGVFCDFEIMPDGAGILTFV